MRTTQWWHDITDQEYYLWHHRRKLAVQVLSHLPTRQACAPKLSRHRRKKRWSDKEEQNLFNAAFKA
jgi:hypothetical protein